MMTRIGGGMEWTAHARSETQKRTAQAEASAATMIGCVNIRGQARYTN